MAHPKHFERDAPRNRAYSPDSTSSYDGDPYDRRAVQAYRSRDSRAVQPYYSSGYSSPRRQLARRKSESYLGGSQRSTGSRRDQAGGWFKDHGAELIGAAAGGYAGHRKGDDALKTASGAAVGAIGGRVLEYQYKKWNDKREDKKVGRDVRSRRHGYDDDYDGYGYTRGRDGYGYDLEPRYSRSLDRGRSRSRDRSPRNWRDLGSQLKRSLSRKSGRGRSAARDREYDDEPASSTWKDIGREIRRNLSRSRKRDDYDDRY